MWNDDSDFITLRRLSGDEVEGATVINAQWAIDTNSLEVLLYRDDWPIVPLGSVFTRIHGFFSTTQVTRQLVPLEESISVSA